MDRRKHLPFQTTEYGVEWLKEIKAMAELGNRNWSEQLTHFLDLKFKLTESERIHFSKICYKFVDNENFAISQAYLILLVYLLKDEEKVSNLELDWKPFYRIIKRIDEDKVSNPSLALTALPLIINALQTCQRFFSPSHSEEILEEFIPRMNLMHPSQCIMNFGYLVQFIPTKGSNFTWIPAVFSIWERTQWSDELDNYAIDLFSILAHDNQDRPEIVPWTDDILQKIFTVLLNKIEHIDFVIGTALDGSKLPKFFRRHHSITNSGKITYRSSLTSNYQSPLGSSIAEFISCTIYPEGETALKTMRYVEDFIDIVEPFCHPSSGGPWTLKILQVFEPLTENLLARRKKEESEKCVKPHRLRLKQVHYNKIVQLILPLALLASYGENETEIDMAQSIILNLSYLAPSLVFEKVVPIIFSSLGNLVQSNRRYSSLSMLVRSVPSIVRVEESKYLIETMLATVDGIDLNDEVKASLTMLFYTFLSYYAPFTENGQESKFVGILTQWIESFVNKVIVCIRNLPERRVLVGDNPAISNIENMCEAVFWQLDTHLEDIALKCIMENIDRVLPYALEPFAILCGAFSPKNPVKRLDAFVPLCISKIHFEIALGLGSIPGESDSLPYGMASISDSILHWYQMILACVCNDSGVALLKYKDEIFRVFKSMTVLKSKLSNTLTFQFFCNCVRALINVYPLNYSSHSFEKWQNGLDQSNWGERITKENLNVEWHIPNPEEIEFALYLLQFGIDLAVENLESLLKSEIRSESYAEFTKWIELLLNLLVVTKELCKPQKNENLQYSLTFLDADEPRLLPCNWIFTNYESAEYKYWKFQIQRLQNVLQSSIDCFLDERLEDPNCAASLVYCAAVEIFFKFNVPILERYITDCKNQLNTLRDKCFIPRFIRIKEIYLLKQVWVSKSIQLAGLSISQLKLFDSILRFCISRYETVRSLAFQTLHPKLLESPLLVARAADFFWEILIDPSTTDHQLKGIFNGFKDFKYYNVLWDFIRTHWEFFFKYARAVIELKLHRDLDDELVELVENFMEIFVENYSVISWNMDELNDTNQAEHLKAKKALYDIELKSFVQYLTSIVQNDCHWSISRAVAVILSSTVYSMAPIPGSILEFALKGSISSHPSIRQHCSNLFTECCKVLRMRAKIAGTCHTVKFKTRTPVDSLEFNNICDEFFNWNNYSTYFYDRTDIGYLCFPKEIGVYKCGLSGVEFDDLESSEAIANIIKYSGSEAFWSEYVRNSLFSRDHQSLDFDASIFIAFLLSPHNSASQLYVAKEISSLIKKGEPQCHRIAAQLYIGLIYSLRHVADRLNPEVIQITREIITAVYESDYVSSKYWTDSLEQLYSSLDSKRFIDIINLTWEYVAIENLNIKAVNGASLIAPILAHSRCSADVINKALDILLTKLDSSHQESRDAAGSGIEYALQQHSRLIDLQNPSISHFMKSGFNKQASAHPRMVKLLSGNSNVDPKLFLSWLLHAIASFNASSFFPYHLLFLKFLLQISSESNDPDLLEMTNELLKLFPYCVVTKSYVDGALDILEATLESMVSNSDSVSFHFVIRILNVFMVFYFKHLLFISRERRLKIVELHFKLIESKSIEVRVQVSKNLSVILKCSLKADLQNLAIQYLKILRELPLPKRQRREERTEEYKNSIMKRHGVVSVLCSVIQSYPFELPEWLVEVLITVAGCSSNPSPINELVKRTFADFKKTHQDSWEMDKLKFTEDELFVITELVVSPSYYA